MEKTNDPGPPDPPPDLKPWHCGWSGQLVKTCRGCGRKFSRKAGDWELNPCPDCGTHRYCMLKHRRGVKKCRVHGAGTKAHPGGNPRTNSGMFSEALTGTGYKEKYEEFRDSDDYLRLREFIALVDSRLVELARRVESHDSARAWDDLEEKHRAVERQHEASRNALAGLIRAINGKDEDGIRRRIDQLAELAQDQKPVNELGLVIQEGKADWANWHDFLHTLEQRKKLSDSERRLMVDMHQMLTLQQAMELFQVVIMDIREVIGDSDQLAVIGSKILERLSDKDRRANEMILALPFQPAGHPQE